MTHILPHFRNFSDDIPTRIHEERRQNHIRLEEAKNELPLTTKPPTGGFMCFSDTEILISSIVMAQPIRHSDMPNVTSCYPNQLSPSTPHHSLGSVRTCWSEPFTALPIIGNTTFGTFIRKSCELTNSRQ